MAEETIFSKIINKEIPADLLYQDQKNKKNMLDRLRQTK